ncbi:MAG: chemotaxis protein CheW [Gammaproteobacteria bacterium]|nr:chemotaxis protein CheW [Gammaproteobacteria bacterium]
MTQTDEKSSVIRTQLIPLVGMNMVLPNTCIAEIINPGELNPVKKTPRWFLGMMDWRGVRIPVISFEAANDIASNTPMHNVRIVVLNGIGGDDKLPFYGVISQGIPKLMRLEKSTINTVKIPGQKLPLASEQTQLADATSDS